MARAAAAVALVVAGLVTWSAFAAPVSTPDPPEKCDVPGVAPGPDGTCLAPRQWELAGKPPRLEGLPTRDSFRLRRAFGQPDLPRDTLLKGELPPGRVELRSLYISVDPTHNQCQKNQKEGYPCMTYTVAEVVSCTEPCKYPVGTRLMSNLWWKEVQIWPAEQLPVVTPDSQVLVLPDPLPPKVSPSHYVGVLGMPGWTSYAGLFRIGNVTCPGETVLITGAAGVCGAMLGQMAKILGCRVVGTAGSDAKVRHLKETLGFDEAINYKTFSTVESMQGALKAAAPEGYDFYFDNTAGHVTTAAWPLLNDRARVAVCGGIAHYYAVPPWWHHGVWYKELPLEPDGSAPIGPTPMGKGPVSTVSRGRRITVEALVWHELNKKLPFEKEFYERVPAWISEGKLKVDETVYEGFEYLPDAFIGLFTGKNTGKMVIKLNWPTTSPPRPEL